MVAVSAMIISLLIIFTTALHSGQCHLQLTADHTDMTAMVPSHSHEGCRLQQMYSSSLGTVWRQSSTDGSLDLNGQSMTVS